MSEMVNKSDLTFSGRLQEALKSFGLPRLIIALFLLLLFILAPVVGADLPTQLTNTITAYVEVDSDLRLSKLMIALQEGNIMLNTIDPFGPDGDDYDGYKLELEILNRSISPEQAMAHLRGIPSVRFAQRLDESRS